MLARRASFSYSLINSQFSSGLSFLYQIAIRLWPPVSEELPDLADFLDFIEIQIRHDHFFFVARSFCNQLAAGRAEIALTVELADIPGMLTADTIDRTDKISVGHGVSGLFELPEILA